MSPIPSQSALRLKTVSKMLSSLSLEHHFSPVIKKQKKQGRGRQNLKLTVPITNSLIRIGVMETNEASFKQLIVPFANA